MAGIPLSDLVEVNSVGVRDTFSLSKLPTLLITKQNELPSARWYKFYDYLSVGQAFGNQSTAKKFAENYFGFTNKKASRADLLNVYVYNENATAPAIVGNIADDITKLRLLNGNFALELDGVKRDIEADLSQCVSLSDVATTLQNAIRLAGSPETILNVDLDPVTELNIVGGTGEAELQIVINTNAPDFEVEYSNQDVITFDKDTKTITALKAGSSVIQVRADKDNACGVFQKINVDVVERQNDQSPDTPFLDITATPQGTPAVIEAEFLVRTNAETYNSTISDVAKVSFIDGHLKGLEAGEATLTFTAQYKNAQPKSQDFTIEVSADLTLTITKGAPQETIIVENAFSLASVVYSQHTQGFILTSGSTGENATISFLTSPSSGANISESLGLSEIENAKIFAGKNAITSFSQVLSEIDVENGSYYVIQADFHFSDDEKLEFSSFIHASNDRYCGIINSQNRAILQNETALQKYDGYNGMIWEYTSDKKPLGFSAGIISSLDFSATNGNANIAFNDATRFADGAIETLAELRNLDSNKANGILKYQQIGQSSVWYGKGFIMGPKTKSANVYVANSYLAFQLQFAFANMFVSQSFVGLRGADNTGLFLSYLSDVFSRGINAGIIVDGATLTTTERNALISAFGANDSQAAIEQCEKVGYFYKIDSVDLVTQTLKIVCAYVANLPAHKIVINNYILGA